MSYILEALRRSQQERELGQVPTLDTSDLFSDDKVPESSNHWGLLAVGLAALAVAISLYAALRLPTAPPAGPPAEPAVDPQPAVASAPQAEMPKTAPMSALAPAMSPLVEAPPPKRSSRPATAEPPVSRQRRPSESDAETRLARQMEADRYGADGTPIQASIFDDEADLAPTAVPPDLIEDVERFKAQIRRERGEKPASPKPKRAKLTGDLTRLRLTPDQQATLPAYFMTAHVYDADRSKRFVVINSLKYQEGEDTREGLKVERILPQGTVLSFAGNPFFVSR